MSKRVFPSISNWKKADVYIFRRWIFA